jgi:hypothetical protein
MPLLNFSSVNSNTVELSQCVFDNIQQLPGGFPFNGLAV